MDAGAVDGAAKQFFELNQAMARVQVQAVLFTLLVTDLTVQFSAGGSKN
jgi:hypothetical protein